MFSRSIILRIIMLKNIVLYADWNASKMDDKGRPDRAE